MSIDVTLHFGKIKRRSWTLTAKKGTRLPFYQAGNINNYQLHQIMCNLLKEFMQMQFKDSIHSQQVLS